MGKSKKEEPKQSGANDIKNLPSAGIAHYAAKFLGEDNVFPKNLQRILENGPDLVWLMKMPAKDRETVLKFYSTDNKTLNPGEKVSLTDDELEAARKYFVKKLDIKNYTKFFEEDKVPLEKRAEEFEKIKQHVGSLPKEKLNQRLQNDREQIDNVGRTIFALSGAKVDGISKPITIDNALSEVQATINADTNGDKKLNVKDMFVNTASVSAAANDKLGGLLKNVGIALSGLSKDQKELIKALKDPNQVNALDKPDPKTGVPDGWLSFSEVTDSALYEAAAKAMDLPKCVTDKVSVKTKKPEPKR